MSKVSKKKKKEKRIRLPAEYTEGPLHFKTGPGWKACYDRKRELYTAETIWAGYYDLYEINEEIFSKLNEIFEDVLDLDETPELIDATSSKDIEEWDSLSHIQLIVAIEKHFKIKFTSKEILSWQNVGELIDCIAAK